MFSHLDGDSPGRGMLFIHTNTGGSARIRVFPAARRIPRVCRSRPVSLRPPWTARLAAEQVRVSRIRGPGVEPVD